MAIQPIDLSVMYSQMDNVSKFNASQNQLIQTANQQGRDKTAAESLEKSKTVQTAARNEVESNAIKNNLEEGGSAYGSLAKRKKRKDEKEDEEKPEIKEFSDPLLGHIIDIVG